VRLEGSLDAFSLPDIFSLLAMTKKTGGLHLRHDSAHGVVWLTDGALTGGESNIDRASLARRLAGSGLVGDEALATAVDRVQSDPEVGMARALGDVEAVAGDILHAVVSEQIVDTVFDLLRWADGSFEFVIGEVNVDDVGVARSIDEVVTEARQRLESWATIAARIPAADTVLAVNLTPPTDPALSRDEWTLLALVDGHRPVSEIVSLGGRGEYAVVGALAEMVGRGLIGIDGDSIDVLVRRHALLAPLDRAAGTPSPSADPVVDAGDTEDDVPVDAAETEDDGDAMADVQPIIRDTGQGRDRIGVTPARAEPFIPPRRPDHPETGLAAVAGGGPATAVAAAIERDPSVNKSLLLRLIAGVRGL
jgi:hypothetical protein